MNGHIFSFFKRIFKRSNLKSASKLLAIIVVFVTTYVLILPGFTLDQETASTQGGIDVPAAATEEDADTDADIPDAGAEGTDEKSEETADSDNAIVKKNTKEAKSTQNSKPEELVFEGDDYTVTVIDKNSILPEAAHVESEEICKDNKKQAETFDEYVAKTEEALGWDEGTVSYARIFDIKIVDSEGNKFDIPEPVDVSIKLADRDSNEGAKGSQKTEPASAEDLYVVHFPDGAEEGEEVESSTENGEEGSVVEFEAEGFSVYSIVEAPEPVPEPVQTSVADLEEFTENYGDSKGFVLSYGENNYFTNTVNNKNAYVETKKIAEASRWFFEAGEEENTYYVYTMINGEKQYMYNTSGYLMDLSDVNKTLFTLSETEDGGKFYFYTDGKNLQHSKGGSGIRLHIDKNDNGKITITYASSLSIEDDPYGLDGKTFGIAYNDDSTSAAAMMAEKVNNQNRLQGLDLLIRNDVANNSGNLLVAENSDIQEWTFESAGEDNYYIKTTVDGAEKYLRINGGSVTLVEDKASASQIRAIPGTDENSGKWHFKVGNNSLNYDEKNKNFNAANNSNASTWLNLVEKSTLTEDDFVEYSARKISASDDILSASAEEKAKVVVYTRVWNDTTKKYEFYAVDHDGSLVRVYDSGDMINWIGNKVNLALWEFTEYTNTDGTPNYYYELENTAYTGTYLAPQSESIISNQPVGINLNGRRAGFDYTSIVAWDDDAYAYSGLKIEKDENGSLKAVTCSLDEADDFYFAVIEPPVGEADPTTTVKTVDNNEHGISIRMIDFNNRIDNNRDVVQRSYFGYHPWNKDHAFDAETGLLSTNLEDDGYPLITAETEKQGSSLSGLFNNMTPANHLFIQSVYNESGYFEYDSTQNFAHYNTEGDNAGDFTVYNQLGAIGAETGGTRTHGQFMPYNDISAEAGYAHDNQGNVITNKTNIRGDELPDTDPRKGEPLYSIPQNNADYFYGMELSAVFTQTPDGVDDWGHDIIFEFTGDDDFWFYVDGELVLDLGGVHSAIGGSVNFRTGEVVCNGVTTSLYEIFKENYRNRDLDESEVEALFETKTVNGETVHVFKDYTKHEMKMFYMERGAGASNLKMRFNLASVKPGTVELSKRLKGTDKESNKLIQYPYQIWYQEAVYVTDENGKYVIGEDGNYLVDHYEDPVRLKQPAPNEDLTGKAYVVYKGTKTLISGDNYKESMEIGGITYDNVFLLKAGETAVINFPEDTYQYKIVECGVDTAVYEHVYINGDEEDDEIFGKPYNNTDGCDRDPETEEEILPDSTTKYNGTARSDFGIAYDSTQARPGVEYINEVPPEVMRTVSFKKVLYDSEGAPLSEADTAKVTETFSFRLYLGNEFADQDNLDPAYMYTYYIKDPDGNYCKWDKANKKFVPLNAETFEEFKNLGKADQHAGTFTTSMYGSISKIPAGYTVEVRDLIVGTKYKIDEPDRELPRGYTRRDSDGFVRTDHSHEDLPESPVVYYTENDNYGPHHYEEGSTITAEPISDTIAYKTESPEIEIRNQEGWGLTAKKEWTDKDFMIHDPIYLAVYLKKADGTLELIRENEAVRRLNKNETEAYWFFPDLMINGSYHNFEEFTVREVELTDPVVDENDVVTSYGSINPVDEGRSIEVSGKTYSGTPRTESYTVNYSSEGPTGHNENIRTDTITNSRPGIQIYKTDWSGKELSGAVFTLKDSEGNDVGHATYTSDSKGLVTTAYLSEGTFTLDEVKTPAGYEAMDEPVTITVTTTEPGSYDLTVKVGTTIYYVTLSGSADFYTSAKATDDAMARITVKNLTVEGLEVIKEGINDENERIPLGGVHFALYDQVKDSEGHVRPAYTPKTGYEDLVTNENGVLEEITMNVGPGTYYLKEKAVPSGYKKLAEDLCFTIGEKGNVVIHNALYSSWLTRDTSAPGKVSYKINIENTPLGITIRKTDEKLGPLNGSKFELSKMNDAGSPEIVTENGLENGLIDLTDIPEKTIAGMSNGVYKLSEINAPPGYVILTGDIYFKVSDGAVTLTDENGETKAYSDVVLLDDNTTIAVKNTPGAALPHTGGTGTGLIYLLGILLTGLSCAGFMFLNRKKRAGDRA